MIHRPNIATRGVSWVAEKWMDFQNKVANVLGFKSANTASGTVGVVGVTSMAVGSVLAAPVAPAIYGAGVWLALFGAGGLAENKFTRWVAGWRKRDT
jgi:hypothetical protein